MRSIAWSPVAGHGAPIPELATDMRMPPSPNAGPTPTHWEDFVEAGTFALGSRTVTKDEIVRYAATFDPQPLHLDEEAARHTMVGRLCASGWHTCSIAMRIMTDGFLGNAEGLGSPGITDARFLKPVFPNDTLSATFRTLSKRTLRSRPGVGLVEAELTLTNQAGEVVLTWVCPQLFRMRGEAVTENRETGR